jgi:signal transduction histidine kinase
MTDPSRELAEALDQLRSATETLASRDAERAALYERLVDQRRAVLAANRASSDFVANMSHELRTPLNAMIGFTELVVEGVAGPLTAQQHEYLDDALKSARHLLTLVNDVLDLAKVEAGALEILPEGVNVVAAAREVLDLLSAKTAEKRITPTVTIDPTLAEVVIDGRRLKQILYHYLSNAVKFTPADGIVDLSILPEGEDDFRIEVTDSGIGILDADLGKLFVETQQLDTGFERTYTGAGVGLVLTKQIADALGGSVGVTSVAGRGSCFHAVLPRVALARHSRPPPSHEPPLVSSSTGAFNVLVIEADPLDRAWMLGTLAQAGYSAEWVESGRQALVRCRQRKFDAVTLDVLLPDMSGVEVLRVLRASGPNKDVPVVIVSEVAEREYLSTFPIQAVLTKPTAASELLAALLSLGLPPDERRLVLILDDNPPAREVVLSLLRSRGVEEPVETREAERSLLELSLRAGDALELLRVMHETVVREHVLLVVWCKHPMTADERARLLRAAGARDSADEMLARAPSSVVKKLL